MSRPVIESVSLFGLGYVGCVSAACLASRGYRVVGVDVNRDKMDTLSGFKHPSKYDAQFLLKPTSKANTKLILAEEDNIKHVFASLATKVTSQSVIIGKLSSYARRNRTKKALWELDNLHRSRYLLSYVDSLRLRRNVQRALNRGESYHKLVRAVAYANAGKLRVRTRP